MMIARGRKEGEQWEEEGRMSLLCAPYTPHISHSGDRGASVLQETILALPPHLIPSAICFSH